MTFWQRARAVWLGLALALAAPHAHAQTDPSQLLERLRALPGVTSAVQASTSIPGTYFYRLTFEQPVDHAVPAGATFQQRLTVLHRDVLAPVVLVTHGYGASMSATQAELTHYLSANQVRVEHRFFNTSTPNPPDWSKLTIAQSAADLHAINLSLKSLYPSGWVSTGASKSGMTSVYYRYYYPDDVQATVPYVAPSSHGIDDRRYAAFLSNVGPSDCRTQMQAFQVAALQQREAILPLIQDGQYTHLGKDRALEFAVLETPFAFWQYLSEASCSQIPPASATPAQLLEFIDAVVGIEFYGDATLDYYGPYFYQSATQLGGPAYEENHLSALLRYPGQDVPGNYPPANVDKAFDASIMPAIEYWVLTQARRFIFIYGDNDPWSTNAFRRMPRNESYQLRVRGQDGNHGASLATLTASERDSALAKLRAWLGMSPKAIDASRKAAAAPPPARTLMREDRTLR
ncbi:MAG: S28 family serine protease [Luteimonas sp.]